MSEVHVVIAGGGPTGLMLACELALHGVTPIVLDSLPGPNPEPRANGVGGPAVRLLDHRGLYEALSSVPGAPAPSPFGMFSGFPLDVTQAPSSQMYMLFVQQPRLARALAERGGDLAVDLRWGHRLSGFTQHDDGVLVDVHGPDGPYQITAGYLVGADGGRSATRKLAGIDFPGMSSNDAVIRMGRGLTFPPEWLDPVTGRWVVPGYGPLPATPFMRAGNGMLLHANRAGFSMIGAMELAATADDTRAADHPGFGDPLSLAELEDGVSRILGVRVPLRPVQPGGEILLRRFAGVNSRIADRYRDGRIFLVGDAAHVHSPLGGPGLNLCLQDAANLGWKLAAVILGRVDPGLLDTYDTERRLAAERVIMHSRAQFALMRPGPEIDALRELFGEMVGEPEVTRFLVDTLAGTAVRYPTEPSDHPAVGHWVPDLTIDTPAHGIVRTAEFARDARPLLLDFTGAALLDDMTESISVVAGKPVQPVDFTAALIRPDGYVAWASSAEEPDTGALRLKLANWFGFTITTPSGAPAVRRYPSRSGSSSSASYPAE